MKYWMTAFVVTVSFALGATTMWAMQDEQKSKEPVVQHDPVAEMHDWHERMRRDMNALMTAPMFGFPGMAGQWSLDMFSTMAPTQQLTFREDNRHVVFELDVDGQDVSHVNVETENGYLTIRAELESKSANSYRSSTLSRTMPIPANANVDTLEILNEGDRVVIRMEKA